MARKNESILDLLALLPSWVSVALSGSSYLILKYFIPTIEFQQKGPADMTYMFFKGLANAAPSIAPIIALFLLIPAPISVINSWRKHKLLDRQESIDTVRNLNWKEFEELVGEAYRRQGYTVYENTGAGPDLQKGWCRGAGCSVRKEENYHDFITFTCKGLNTIKIETDNLSKNKG